MDVPTELFVGIVAGLVVAVIQRYFFESRSSPKVTSISQAQISPAVIYAPSKVIAMVSTGVECIKCGTKNREENRFCTKCGSALYEECPNCGHSKPVIEERCSNCGKDPKELRRMDRAMLSLRNKARLLGLAYAAVFLRTLLLSWEPNSIDVLSGLAVVPGIIGLAWEANSEFSWLRKARIWQYRQNWLMTTAQNIEQSYWIFALIVYSVALQVVILIYRVVGWLI